MSKSNTEEKIVLRDSDEAAYLGTVTGWISRHGYFYGNDESLARYAGCTHVKCACGAITEKIWLKCDSCRWKDMVAKYEKLPEVDWDGKTPLCLYDDDQYFFDEDSIYDYCDENEVKVADLRLVLCEPVYAREIDPNEYLCDDFPPDMTLKDIAPELAEAFERLNETIRNYNFFKEPLAWVAGKKRVKPPEGFDSKELPCT